MCKNSMHKTTRIWNKKLMSEFPEVTPDLSNIELELEKSRYAKTFPKYGIRLNNGRSKFKEKKLFDERKFLIFIGRCTPNKNNSMNNCIIFIACHKPVGDDRFREEATTAPVIAAPKIA
jgi:hypothetical protein